jgi:hypothetical protein
MFEEAILEASNSEGKAINTDDLAKFVSSLQEYAGILHVLAKSYH